jgi:protein subunit release factor A
MINEEDLKIDSHHSSGAARNGAWGLRNTHTPSGVSVMADGEFAKREDPERAILRARSDLLEEIEARLEDAYAARAFGKDAERHFPDLGSLGDVQPGGSGRLEEASQRD